MVWDLPVFGKSWKALALAGMAVAALDVGPRVEFATRYASHYAPGSKGGIFRKEFFAVL